MLCNVLETSVEGENGAGLMTYCSFIYPRMDQVKFVEDSLYKIWSDMVC